MKVKRKESTEQKYFFEYFSYYPKVRRSLFAIPNGGKRDIAEAAHLRLQGVTPGVADVFLAVPSGGFHGLFIEFKVNNNKLTEPQRLFFETMSANGYETKVCYTGEEAIQETLLYLGDKNALLQQ